MSCAASRYVVILAATLGAIGSDSAKATDTEPAADRFAVILLPVGADTGAADDCRPLHYALERNGFRGTAKGATPDISQTSATAKSVRGAINAVINGPHDGAQMVFYYRGPFCFDGGFSLGKDAPTIESKDLVGQLKRLGTHTSSSVLLLDVDSDNSLKELEEAVAGVLQQVDGNLHVLIGRRESSAKAHPSAMIPLLRRALTYDREADRDGDEAVTIPELAAFLGERLHGKVDVGCVSAPAADKSTQIACFRRTSLDDVVEDLSDAIACEVRNCGATVVAIPDFEEECGSATKASPPRYSGPLVPYLAERVRRRTGRTLEQVRIVAGRLENSESAEATTALVAAMVNVDLAQHPVRLTVSSKVVVRQGDRPVQTIPLHDVAAPLNVDETGMSGQVNMSPKAAMSAGIHWTLDDPDAPPVMARHPMANPDFPLQVYLESKDGTRLDHAFSQDGRHMLANLAEGDEYTVVVENRTSGDFFLRLLVDGRNTLPDRTAEDEAYGPAQYVSLTAARCWLCEAGKTYRIAGFYTQVDADGSSASAAGQWQAFRVTDVGNVSADGEYRGQLGIITAAFYEPVEKTKSSMASQPQFATCLGEAGNGQVEVYTGDLGPGPLFGNAPINIHYGFRTDGDH